MKLTQNKVIHESVSQWWVQAQHHADIMCGVVKAKQRDKPNLKGRWWWDRETEWRASLNNLGPACPGARYQGRASLPASNVPREKQAGLFRLPAQSRFLAHQDYIQILQIGSKPHLGVVWNVIPIRFPQMRLSPDALAAQDESESEQLSRIHAATSRAVWRTILDSAIIWRARWWISVSHVSALESRVTSVGSYWRLRRYHSNPCR